MKDKNVCAMDQCIPNITEGAWKILNKEKPHNFKVAELMPDVLLEQYSIGGL